MCDCNTDLCIGDIEGKAITRERKTTEIKRNGRRNKNGGNESWRESTGVATEKQED